MHLQYRRQVYDSLPQHIQGAMRRYVENGIRPGEFCWAVLCNDLMEAYKRADNTNVARMRDIVCWIYQECPYEAHGSEEICKEWIRVRVREQLERIDAISERITEEMERDNREEMD